MAIKEPPNGKNIAANFSLRAILLFALSGTLFWAMRGANGYGGISGAVVPALMWGLVWSFLESSRGRNAAWIATACSIGFGIGGFNGYGQYIAWIHGEFHVIYPEKFLAIAPWKGYAGLLICGAGWGGVGGNFLATALNPEKSRARTALRFIVMIAGATAGFALVATHPKLFFPFYSTGLYNSSACTDCGRNVVIIKNIAGFIGAFTFAAIYDIALRRVKSFNISMICAAGFGLAFAGFARIQLLGVSLPGFDWWKVWEMLIGMSGGISIAIIYILNKRENVESSNTSGRTAGAFADNIVMFLVFNWAAHNCTRILAEYLNLAAGNPFRNIVFVALFVISAVLFIRDAIEKKIPNTNNARSKAIILHIVFSIMALIVIFPDKKILMIFILLSASVLLLLITTKQEKIAEN
jgi:hypothetical protein